MNTQSTLSRLSLGATVASLLLASTANALAERPSQPRVIPHERTFTVAACAERSWCKVSLSGREVLAMSERVNVSHGADGICMRGNSADVQHIAESLNAFPHLTRSGAVCVYANPNALPANPAVRSDGVQ